MNEAPRTVTAFNAELLARENSQFMRVVKTTPQTQLVVMNIQYNEDEEQVFGNATAVYTVTEGILHLTLYEANGARLGTTSLPTGTTFVIPAQVQHRLANRTGGHVRVLGVLSPPVYEPDTVRRLEASFLDVVPNMQPPLTSVNELTF